MARRPPPGGVGDGLPALPDGEPILARWFVLAMIVMSLVAVTFTVIALSTRTAPPDEVFPAAARRPPGDAQVTHERGAIELATDTTEEVGPACTIRVRLVGDEGGRSTMRRALEAVCQQLTRDTDDTLEEVRAGIAALDAGDGILRVALAEATGVDSSARVEDELAALTVQLELCERLGLTRLPDPPRGCDDAAAVLAEDDPAGALRSAGYGD